MGGRWKGMGGRWKGMGRGGEDGGRVSVVLVLMLGRDGKGGLWLF